MHIENTILLVVTLIVLISVGAYILHCVILLFKRGYKKEAAIILITTPLIIGLIIAIKFISKRPAIKTKPITESCPECGSKQGYYEQKNIIVSTGMEAMSLLEQLLWFGCVIVFSALSFLLVLLALSNLKGIVFYLFIITLLW